MNNYVWIVSQDYINSSTGSEIIRIYMISIHRIYIIYLALYIQNDFESHVFNFPIFHFYLVIPFGVPPSGLSAKMEAEDLLHKSNRIFLVKLLLNKQSLAIHSFPSPLKFWLQLHSNDPLVFLHVALSSQSWTPVAHSLTSSQVFPSPSYPL